MHNISGKKIATLIPLLLIWLPFYGQYNIKTHDEKHERKKYHFGIHLGFSQHTFKVKHADAFLQQSEILSVESKKSLGFGVGLVGALHLLDNTEFRIVPAINFGTKNLTYGLDSTTDPLVQDQESVTLGFPLHFKYKSKPYKEFRMYAFAGGRMTIDLASNKKERQADDVVKFEKSEGFVELGAGAEIHFPLFTLSPELKISQSLRNQHVPNDALNLSNVINTLNSRCYLLSINIE